MKAVDEFIHRQSEPNKSCFMGLRSLLLEFHSKISETTKYGMPCYLFEKGILCYLWKDKKTQEPYILFVDGHELDFTELESDGRAKMKIFRVDPSEDIPIDRITPILNRAIQLPKYSKTNLK